MKKMCHKIQLMINQYRPHKTRLKIFFLRLDQLLEVFFFLCVDPPCLIQCISFFKRISVPKPNQLGPCVLNSETSGISVCLSSRIGSVQSKGLGPFPTFYLPRSCSEASVTPSSVLRFRTRCQPIDFLGAHLWLQSSGRSSSGWRTTWGLFIGELFYFYFFHVFLADKQLLPRRSRGSWRSVSAGLPCPRRDC